MSFTKMKDRAYAASLLHTTPQSSPQPHEAEGARLAQQVKSRWTFGICPRFSQGLPQVALVVKNPPANAGDVRDSSSIPGLGKIPWRRAWQPTPVFLPEESHGQGSLAGYSP